MSNPFDQFAADFQAALPPGAPGAAPPASAAPSYDLNASLMAQPPAPAAPPKPVMNMPTMSGYGAPPQGAGFGQQPQYGMQPPMNTMAGMNPSMGGMNPSMGGMNSSMSNLGMSMTSQPPLGMMGQPPSSGFGGYDPSASVQGMPPAGVPPAYGAPPTDNSNPFGSRGPPPPENNLLFGAPPAPPPADVNPFGAPAPQSGYGAPPADQGGYGFGAPPADPGFGGQPAYGGPPGYGAPAPVDGGMKSSFASSAPDYGAQPPVPQGGADQYADPWGAPSAPPPADPFMGALVPAQQQSNPYAAYGVPPPQQQAPAPDFGGYGAPPPQDQGYGAPPPNSGYGAPPPQDQGYGAPPPNNGYGAPPPQDQGFGAPPPNSGYGAPPPQDQGFGAPPPNSGYGAPPPQDHGYGAPPPNDSYGAPAYGSSMALTPYGAPPPQQQQMTPYGAPPPGNPYAPPNQQITPYGAPAADPFSVFEQKSAPAPPPAQYAAPTTYAAQAPQMALVPAPAQTQSNDNLWGDLGFDAPPVVEPPAPAPGPVLEPPPRHSDEKKTSEESLPPGGEYYDARIFTPTLGVMFFKPQELTDSLFLNTEHSIVDGLAERPIVAFIVEGSSARAAGVELGHVLLKVNGVDVKNPKEASRLIKEGPRPLPLLFYVPNTDIVVAEGEHMVKYDTRETTAPNSAKDWKPKYVVIGGIIAQPWMMNMYRSKSEYDIAVIETQARRPVSVKVKQFSLQGARIQNDWQGPQMVKYKNKIHPWKYIVVLPVARNPIKISSPNLAQLKPVHEGIRRVLLAQNRDRSYNSQAPVRQSHQHAQGQDYGHNGHHDQGHHDQGYNQGYAEQSYRGQQQVQHYHGQQQQYNY